MEQYGLNESQADAFVGLWESRPVSLLQGPPGTGKTKFIAAVVHHPDPGLVHFVHDLTRRAGGRVFTPDTERLGEYVVADYLRTRRGRRAR